MLRTLSSAATSGADAAAINTATAAAPTNPLIRYPRPFPDRAALGNVRKYSRVAAGKSIASADDRDGFIAARAASVECSDRRGFAGSCARDRDRAADCP